jgi:hypothetical protein
MHSMAAHQLRDDVIHARQLVPPRHRQRQLQQRACQDCLPDLHAYWGVVRSGLSQVRLPAGMPGSCGAMLLHNVHA